MKTPDFMIKIKGSVDHLNFRRMEECSTILRWLNPLPGERILDIGCGDGYYDWLMARSGAFVAGIDLHDKRLAQARRYHSGERTEFHYMDAGKLSFPDALFDKTVSLCVMEHLDDDERVMRNVHRLLKPGGSLIFSADSLSAPCLTPEERQIHQKRYAVKTFYTVENITEKLSRTGFEMEEARYILRSPAEISLIRFSWKMDDWPACLTPFRWLGYSVCAAALKASRLKSRHLDHPAAGGLTLLVRARKRPAA